MRVRMRMRMRMMMMVVVVMSMPSVVVTRRIFSLFGFVGRYAPESVAAPRSLLAFFAAVFSSSAPSALGKLSCVFLPLATLPVCALADPTSALVFATQVTHNHSRPVLHCLAVL